MDKGFAMGRMPLQLDRHLLGRVWRACVLPPGFEGTATCPSGGSLAHASELRLRGNVARASLPFKLMLVSACVFAGAVFGSIFGLGATVAFRIVLNNADVGVQNNFGLL